VPRPRPISGSVPAKNGRPDCASPAKNAPRDAYLRLVKYREEVVEGLENAPAGHDTRALQAYLGHRNIQHTVRYTEPAPKRFKDFWR
jgi:hypothetical protein